MPSTSQKQHDFMLAACKDKAFAEKNHIDQETACEFVKADKDSDKWQKKPVYYHWKGKDRE